jgi:hypothetical protein
MGAIVLGLRPGDQERLKHVADQWGRPPKEVAGILLEEAIRRETGERRDQADLQSAKAAR